MCANDIRLSMFLVTATALLAVTYMDIINDIYFRVFHCKSRFFLG